MTDGPRQIQILWDWVDPAILALNPGDTATLRAMTNSFGHSRKFVHEGAPIRIQGWMAPTSSSANLVETAHVAPDDIVFEGYNVLGRGLGLYNVGGPSRHLIERTVLPGKDTGSLRVRARPGFTAGEWVQIRLYDAEARVKWSGQSPSVTVQRRLGQPVKTIWIVGA